MFLEQDVGFVADIHILSPTGPSFAWLGDTYVFSNELVRFLFELLLKHLIWHGDANVLLVSSMVSSKQKGDIRLSLTGS